MQKPRFVKMVGRYQFLMENLYRVNVSTHEDFQRTYNCFFQLRRNKEYRVKHFEFLEQNKGSKVIGFHEILIFLSGIEGKVEASFASKMLSIINPNMPVLDSKVLEKLGIKKRVGSNINDVVMIYNKICEWYDGFYKTSEYHQWITLFDEMFPNSGISSAKKIDFILWQV